MDWLYWFGVGVEINCLIGAALTFYHFRKIKEVSDSPSDLTFLVLNCICLLPLFFVVLYAPDCVRKLGPFLRQGVSLMKRKLFTTLFLMALGGEVLPSIGYQPQLFDRVMAWWNAPPVPPSPEAQRLIASLENMDGWRLGKTSAILIRGNVSIIPHQKELPWETPRAWIGVNDAVCSDHFSNDDRARINESAQKCLRKLTAQALEAAK